MPENKKQKIYFIPLYYYLTVPDFQSILATFTPLSLNEKYEIKLLDIQTEKTLIQLNKNIGSNISKLLYETVPFEVKSKTVKSSNNVFSVLKDTFLLYIRKNILLKFLKKKILDNDVIYLILTLPYLLVRLILKKPLYKDIFNFLKKQNPAAIIVSSDLANINIRFILLAAHLQKIPILIYWMGDIESKKESLSYSILNTYIKKYQRYSYFRAVHFNENYNNILGLYAYDATIFVSNNIAKKKLLQAGIEDHRIKIIITQKQPIVNYEDNKTNSLKNHKFIVYYTENLSSIYGNSYLKDLHNSLSELFSQIYKDHGIISIVRPHPMERKGKVNQTLIQQYFNRPGILIDHELSLDYLVQNSVVNIAHFSKVLLDCLLTGNNILSINIQGCDRSFIPNAGYNLLKVQSLDILRETLYKLLMDQEFSILFKKESALLRENLLKGAVPFEIAFQEVLNKKAI